MRMIRTIMKRVDAPENGDDGFVDADRASLFSMVWEITKDAWSFTRSIDAERRLQRDVGAFVKRKG